MEFPSLVICVQCKQRISLLLRHKQDQTIAMIKNSKTTVTLYCKGIYFYYRELAWRGPEEGEFIIIRIT